MNDMKKKQTLITTLLGGSLGLAAATVFVPAPALGGGCLMDDQVRGSSCSRCEKEADGWECNNADFGWCWRDSAEDGCTNGAPW
jgi:hypothetical protein